MKFRILLLISLVLLTACQAQELEYTSQRPKSENMQDLQLIEIKKEQSIKSEELKEQKNEEGAEHLSSEETQAQTTEESVPDSDRQEMDYNVTTDEIEIIPSNDTPEDQNTVILFGTLNLRSGPGTEHNIITVLEDGDVIDIINEEYSNNVLWYYVNYEGTYGYVQSDAYHLVGPQIP